MSPNKAYILTEQKSGPRKTGLPLVKYKLISLTILLLCSAGNLFITAIYPKYQTRVG
ncbi:hypothetical protein SAMN05660816_01232 [Niastella yeongjuensis]|nr:hypothetical protein SAMN05660816_01232 [Niastella yeongjuensis]